MRPIIQVLVGFCVVLSVIAISGCGQSPPPVTEVDGVVTIDGRPLPLASVQFVPDLKNFGLETASSGVTDEQGRYTLTWAYKKKPGAVVGSHRVVITEQPVPAEYRDRSPQSEIAYRRFQNSLVNRPIPVNYSAVSSTPLIVEVKAGEKTYDLALTRGGGGRYR